MRSANATLTTQEAVTIALLMTWSAGFIDIVGYLSLFGLYTAHMSGNTIAMARHIVQHKWWGFARGGWPIATFVFGLVLGSFIYTAEKRRNVRPRFPATVALEILLIAMSTPPSLPARWSNSANRSRIICSGFAIIRGGAFGVASARCCACRRDSKASSAVTFTLWVVYLVGALAGEVSTLRWALLGMLAPLFILAIIVAYGAFRPLISAASNEW